AIDPARAPVGSLAYIRPTLAADFALPLQTIESGLLALQSEGYAMVMNGGDRAEDKTWCERRLLARIHRYSRERRRQRARPVSPAAYMRFLFQWHGLDQPAAELEQALGLLEGWSAPVACWEQALLATRCAEYAPQRLDEQILSGLITWFRPDLPGRGLQQVIAATPITFVPRRHAALWRHAGRTPNQAPAAAEPGASARVVLRALQEHGAMFSTDLEQRSGLLQAQLEQAVAELVAHGLVTADAFSPLRWLIRPVAEKRRHEKRSRGRHGSRPNGLLGRWSLTSPLVETSECDLFPGQAAMAVICAALLRRYGVVFRAVLERESLLPPWRHLLRYLRRMEDRGEVHGGRFVEGFSGEQFALPEAVGLLRNVANEPLRCEQRVISATDPLNLGGIITPGVKTPATLGNRILLLDGIAAAHLRGNELEILGPPGTVDHSEAERRLQVVRAIGYRGANR
ncbi:MAG: ATP-dependent DNA helicase, partial [Xanthomonadales bacterium]|nr:ATP-dependent DNA helicase [Xanthomonadales bacterium]